ncbi:barstar family protein [Kitasatospora sp. NPDC054939]
MIDQGFGGRVRGEDRIGWDRGFPVRYLLVQDDADGVEQVWARCAGVEGLFVDPVPPPREILTLRGCLPEGPLRDVLSAPDVPLRGLGDFGVEVLDGERSAMWYELVDVVVVAHRPHPADPARYDVVIAAGVRDEGNVPGVPAEPRFQLWAGTRTGDPSAGRCSAVDGLFEPREGPDAEPLELIGCEPAAPLLAALEGQREGHREGEVPGWVRLLTLDRSGGVMDERTVALDVVESRPSSLGDGLLDLTLADGGDRPPRAARPIWEQWYQGPPAEPNAWAPYDERGRELWLDLTPRAWRVPVPTTDRSGGEHHLDGRFVTDVPGLHCALAEALLGPGRYFGREWNAFSDCLGGGFGVAPPFTLVWHDSEVARRALADQVETKSGLSYFEEIVQRLRDSRVTVVLR